MARQTESCVFCDCNPCECNKVAKKAPIKKLPPKVARPVVNAAAPILSQQPRAGLSSVPKQLKSEPKRESSDEAVNAAIANLRRSFPHIELISEEELSIDDQIRIWKEERKEWQR